MIVQRIARVSSPWVRMDQFLLSRGADVISARSAIDTELREIDERALRLKFERNKYADTAVLPPELLIQIFLTYAQDVYDDMLPPGHLLLPSHICRHWRMVILGCEEYWGFTPIGFTKWSCPEAIISRSGSRSLRTWMVASSSFIHCGPVDRIGDVFPRLQSLKIFVDDTLEPDSEDSLLLSSILKHPAPLLEIAEISASPNIDSFVISDELFAECCPRLTRLSLSNFYFNWSAPWLSSNLVSLALKAGTGLFCDQIYEVLERMPLLQELILEEYGVELSWDEIFSTQLVTPPRFIFAENLRFLRLTSLSYAVANMCNALRILPDARLRLQCQSPIPGYQDDATVETSLWFTCLLDWIALHHEVLRSLGLEFCRLKIAPFSKQDSTSSYAVLQLWTSEPPLQHPGSPPSTECDLELTLSAPYWRTDGFISSQLPKFLSRLPLSGVQTLHLDHLPNIPLLADGLIGLTNVYHLHLFGRSSFSVLETLGRSPSAHSAEDMKGLQRPDGICMDQPPPPSNLLPKLHTVTFHCINFRGFNTVLDFLRSRTEQGLPIEALSYQDCSGLSSYWLRELRGLCPTIECDEACDIKDY